MIPLCQYMLQGGKQCEQAAIKGELYCRHHHFVRRAIADAAPQGGDKFGARAPLPFVFPEDRAAVQINYFLVLQAVNAGRLDLKTAAMMIRLLKACDANLKKGSLNEGAETAAADLDDESLPAESEQVEEEDASETIKIEAAEGSGHARNERPSAPPPQKCNPMELLRHSRRTSGKKRRRR